MDKKSLNIAIGSRIKLARENMGWTQEELAEKVDLSTQFISTIERGVAAKISSLSSDQLAAFDRVTDELMPSCPHALYQA